ncbi:MAG: RNA ligase family protein [bacterium]|nr:RNA ligase family protein [bacterium]
MVLTLDQLDSATKYPSIDTIHVLDARQRATDALTEVGALFAGVDPRDHTHTEKVDGMGIRVVLMRGDPLAHTTRRKPGMDWVIGARDHLVAARGDRIPNPLEGVAERFGPIAEQLLDRWLIDSGTPPSIELIALYLELYGGKIGRRAQHYAAAGSRGHRAFDVRMMTADDCAAVARMAVEEIAARRDHGTLPGRWLFDAERHAWCARFDIPHVPTLTVSRPIPTSPTDTLAWLHEVVGDRTRVALGEHAPGRPEGVVVRTTGRSRIVKVAFDPYERALRAR